MIYSDGVHMVADSLEELHEYAKSIGVGRWYFEGTRKGHPHYDIPKKKRARVLEDAELVSSQLILAISWKMLGKEIRLVVGQSKNKGLKNFLDRAALYKFWKQPCKN